MSKGPKISNERASGWAILCHLSALAGWIVPLGNVFLPLIFWLIKKNQNKFIDQTGRAVLNFQISYIIYCVIYGGLIVLAVFFFYLDEPAALKALDSQLPIDLSLIIVTVYVALYFTLILGWLALVIIGAVKAHQLKVFKYLIAIPFFKVKTVNFNKK